LSQALLSGIDKRFDYQLALLGDVVETPGWVAGVELAIASEPPARRPRSWGRRPSGVDSSHPEL